MPQDKDDISREENNTDLHDGTKEVLVDHRELLGEEKVGKPCGRKEEHADKLDLSNDSPGVEEKTDDKLIVPAKDEIEEKNDRVKVSYLNSDSYAGEKKVIIPVGLVSIHLPSLIQIEEDKEDIAEKKTETSESNVKYCNVKSKHLIMM